MKHYLPFAVIFFLLIFMSQVSWAQSPPDPRIDSLRQVLFTQKGEAKAHTLFQLGMAMSSTDIDQSLSHLNAALLLGEQYHDAAFVAKCQLQLASNETRRGKWASGLQFANKALPYYEGKNDSSNLVRLYGILGNTYLELGLNDVALKYQLNALEHMRTTKASPLDLARAYNNVANLYFKIDEVEKATEFYQSALEIFREANDSMRYITILNNMSAIYGTDEVEIALDTLRKALTIAEELDNPNILSMVYFNMAYQNTRAGQAEVGAKFLTLSKEAYGKSQFRYLPPQFLLEEAAIFRSQKEYDSVEFKLRELLMIARKQQMGHFELMAYEQLGSHFKTIDKSDSALLYIEKANTINDSLERAEKDNLLAALKIENAFSQKQSELDQIEAYQLAADRKARWSYWLTVAFLLFVIGGLIFYILSLRRSKS